MIKKNGTSASAKDFSNVCPSVLLRSIHAKIQALNSKLFHHLEQTKKHKLENLTNPRKNRTAPLGNQNHHTVVTIPENLPLSNAEKSVFSKGHNFVPISKKSDEFTIRQDVEKFLRRVQLKAFFHNKEDKSDNTEKDAFETLTAKKSKWTPPEGQFASIDYFIKKCRHDVHKLKSNCNTKLSNLFKEEWTAPIKQSSRQRRRDSLLAHRPLPTRSNSSTFGPDFLHQSQQRPNSRQPKNCQRHHSRTHNKTRTTCHRSESHRHYS